MRDNTATFPYAVNMPANVGAGSGGALGLFIGSVKDSFQLDIQLSALETNGKVKIISHPKVIASDNKMAKVNQGKVIPYQTTSLQGTRRSLPKHSSASKLRPRSPKTVISG